MRNPSKLHQSRRLRKSKSIRYFILLIILFAIATPALADYLGPDRTRTESHVETYDVGVWAKPADGSCTPTHNPPACIVCTWKRNPGNPCGDAKHWYKTGEESHVVKTTINLPPATISGSLLNCTLQNGWCITAPQFSLSANEPLAGESILAIEGDWNGQDFACEQASCSVSLGEGNNSLTYWALSSWGDSSTMGTSSAKVDTVSPNVGLDVGGSSGSNGWFTSPVTLTPTGSDSPPGSGLAGTFLSVDGGAWQPSTTLNEGVYNIAVSASDNAGNVSNSSATISVDTTTPSIDLAIDGTTGSSGWYVSKTKITASASDATSGVALLEFKADGGAYQSYSSPVSFSDGHHTIQFKATDAAGNFTETPSQEFYVDATAPVISLPDSWTLSEIATYKAQDDGSGLASLRVLIEDENEHYARGASKDVSGAKFTGEIDWDGQLNDGTVAPPGTYLAWVKASDVAGNSTIRLGRVTVSGPGLLSNVFQPDDAAQSEPEEAPVPPADLSEPDDRPATTTQTTAALPSLTYGGSAAESTGSSTQSLLLATGTSSASPTTADPAVLWGAAAAAVVSAATAYALDEKRKRKEEEAQQAEAAAKQARKLNEAEEERKIQSWLEGQAILNAQIEEARKQGATEGQIAAIKQAGATQGLEVAIGKAAHVTELLHNAAARQDASTRLKKKEERVEQELESYTAEPQEWEDGYNAYMAQKALEHWREQEQNYTVPAAPPEEKSWWDKTFDWIDEHQVELALGIGIVVGVAAIALSGGIATPLVAAAWTAGAAVVAGGAVATGTIILNVHYGREWNENLVRNVAIGGIAATVVTGGWFLFQAATTMAGSYCALNTTTCARVEPILNALDMAEEGWLATKLGFQTLIGNEAGAVETAFELHQERIDGGMPGNSLAKELGADTLEAIAKYGDEALDLIKLYGADAAEIITKYGDEGIAILQRYGNNAITLIKKHGEQAISVMGLIDPMGAEKLLEALDADVLDHALEQGPEAVEALSRWNEDDLREFGVELALRAKKDAEVLANVKKLIALHPIDPKHLTDAQQALINAIAENSTQYADEGQVVLGKWVDYGSGFVETAQDTGSVHYNPHPDMWNLLGDLGEEYQAEVAWLINKQVVGTGIDKGLPFEYTLNGIPATIIDNEHDAVQAIFSGQADAEIMRILESNYIPIRMKELQELQKAGYELAFDEAANSYILVLP